MDTFTVWYLLSVIYAGSDNLANVVSVHPDLPACEQMAARVIASKPPGTVKYLCHEMTVRTDAKNIYVNLPSN